MPLIRPGSGSASKICSAGADLSGMSDDDLQVGAVVHQANISVDEAGTEAAAATAVVVGETSAPADEPIDFTVDRPFLFAIRDRGLRRTSSSAASATPADGPHEPAGLRSTS